MHDRRARPSLNERVRTGEVGMTWLLMNLSVIVGGVFGGAIGFFVLVASLGVLALPFWLLYRGRETNSAINKKAKDTSDTLVEKRF